MEEIKQGDIVGRKSYNSDVFFKVIDLRRTSDKKKHVYLKGLHLRLCADAPLDDLVKIEPGVLAGHLMEQTKRNSEQMQRIFSRRVKEREMILGRFVPGSRGKEPKPEKQEKMDGYDIPGTVLHIDGDGDYLELCLTVYKQLSIPANGYCIDEEEQPHLVKDLLKKHCPDLLVLTGHDGFIKGREDFRDVDNYYSSKYFVEAVKIARSYEKSKDDLVIFAGACQSHYESILAAGANFASSPQRVLVHAYDPVFIVEKIAYTSIYDPISIKDIIEGTVSGFEGIGGMETRGKYRIGIPKSPFIRAADLSDRDLVVEIGPGLGALTIPLVQNAGRVLAIEVDRGLVPVLAEVLAGAGEVEIVPGDALEMDFDQLVREKTAGEFGPDGGSYKIIANLPYYITSPLLVHILQNRYHLSQVLVMVQQEVAARLAAGPGGKDYGALSVMVQYFTEPEILFKVPRTVFFPAPVVDSAMVRLLLRPPPVQVREEKTFFRVVRAAFGKRRKTLLNALSASDFGLTKETWRLLLEQSAVEAGRRGETLTLAEFARLTASFTAFRDSLIK